MAEAVNGAGTNTGGFENRASSALVSGKETITTAGKNAGSAANLAEAKTAQGGVTH